MPGFSPSTIAPQIKKKFAAIKRTVLGNAYDLDISFVSPRQSHHANKTYRAKNKPTNVLSFPFDTSSGQILICPAIAKKEATILGVPMNDYIYFLFIHGLLHLKGFDHGATMEHKEQEYCALFNLKLGNLWHEQ